MRFSLREEDINEYISLYQNFLEEVQQLNKRVNDELNDVLQTTKYDKLQIKISEIIDAYSEVVIGDIENGLFSKWTSSSGSLRMCMKTYRAGDSADVVCVQIEQNMADLMYDTLRIEKKDAIITDRPIVKEDDLLRIEDICKVALNEIRNIQSGYVAKLLSKNDENEIFGTLRPLFEGIAVSLEAFFEASLNSFVELHEFVRDISRKQHNTIEETVEQLHLSGDKYEILTPDSNNPSVLMKGKSYEKLDSILTNCGVNKGEYIKLARTPQHRLSEKNRDLIFKIRMLLTSDVTDEKGVVIPGTRISKSIDAKTFDDFYQDGMRATLGGCVALERDTNELGDDVEIINFTGLRFDGSAFVDNNGEPNVFYIVDGELLEGQPDLVVRISATYDGMSISEKTLKKFKEKHPTYKYNGYDIDDVSSSNDTYLNQIWNKYSKSQVAKLSRITGISEQNIVTEQPRWYNRLNNPDTGTGITLNQGSDKCLGIPEFFAGQGRIGIVNGHIYRIEGKSRELVGNIDEDGFIELV